MLDESEGEAVLAGMDGSGPLVLHELGTLGSTARGSIGPSGPADEERLRRIAAALEAGACFLRLKPNATVAGRPVHVATDCMDGRPLTPGRPVPGSARVAGGTLLTVFGLWALGGSHKEIRCGRLLVGAGVPTWVHEDCGANNLIAESLDVLTRNRAAVDKRRRRLGRGDAPPVRATQVARLASLVASDDLPGAAQARLDGLAAQGVPVGSYVGLHTELAAVVNLVRGTTLDREAVAAAGGEGAQVFCVDAWALEETAEVALAAVDEDPGLAPELADFMLDLSLATRYVLGSPDLRVWALTGHVADGAPVSALG